MKLPTKVEDSKYPFVPKSVASLRPGHFWQIPLTNGRFACGRVIALCRNEDGRWPRKVFLAGLMDWSSNKLPTSQSIAGSKTLSQGRVHIKTIMENEGHILGFRSLEEDGIGPDLMLSESPGPGCWLMRGCEYLRPATSDEQAILPVFSVWGYEVIKILADQAFTSQHRPNPSL